jgi:hypothetical protein
MPDTTLVLVRRGGDVRRVPVSWCSSLSLGASYCVHMVSTTCTCVCWSLVGTVRLLPRPVAYSGRQAVTLKGRFSVQAFSGSKRYGSAGRLPRAARRSACLAFVSCRLVLECSYALACALACVHGPKDDLYIINKKAKKLCLAWAWAWGLEAGGWGGRPAGLLPAASAAWAGLLACGRGCARRAALLGGPGWGRAGWRLAGAGRHTSRRRRSPSPSRHNNEERIIYYSQNAEGTGAHKGVSGNGEQREAGEQLENKGETSSEGQKVSQERGEQAKAAEAAAAGAKQHKGNRQRAQSTATNAVAVGGEGSRGTVDAGQDPGRSSNSSAPDHSGGETSANSAGGGGFSGPGCEREQREAGKRKRCEEQAATEQVRAKVQRYKRMTDRGGGRVGEQLEAQVQERPWRRARKQAKATRSK